MDAKTKAELIKEHEFGVGDPVLVCGHRQIPGVIVDASELQLKVKINGSSKHIYTTRCKDYTKPNISLMYPTRLRDMDFSEVLPDSIVDQSAIVENHNEIQLEQLLLF